MKKFSIISRSIASFLAVIMFMTPVSSVFAQKAVDNREITVMAERDAKDDAEESGTFLWWCGGFLLTFVIRWFLIFRPFYNSLLLYNFIINIIINP